jgi:hypothetical protein
VGAGSAAVASENEGIGMHISSNPRSTGEARKEYCGAPINGSLSGRLESAAGKGGSAPPRNFNGRKYLQDTSPPP